MAVSYEDTICVVLDTGSQYTKAGFAAEAFPRRVYPTINGRFHRPGLIDGFPEIYCGNEAVQKRGISHLTRPVKGGLITEWDEMERFWHHTFYKELQVPPENAKVMHAVHPLIPRTDKQKMAEILFELFHVQNLYLAKAPALIVHASGRTTGVVWESGASSAYVTPVFEGFPLNHATITSPLTGEAMSNYLQELMSKLGYSFTTPIERDLIDRIKAELCYVAESYDEQLNASASSGDNKVHFDLPDGQRIFLGEERFKCPEILFQPSLAGFDCSNIIDVISSSISKCDLDFRAIFYENLVISGGSSMFKGLEKRLEIILTHKTKNLSGYKAKVDAMSQRQFCAWAGGSILGSMTSLKGFWLTREEYDETGPDSVNHKFF